MTLRSPAFADGGTIPVEYTCAGRGLAPPLAGAASPPAARALALVMEDPDAPGGTFVHWVLVDLPPRTSALRGGGRAAGARAGELLRRRGYGGPCPPEGDAPHHYVFRSTRWTRRSASASTSPGDVRTAIGRHAIASGRLTGRFGR